MFNTDLKIGILQGKLQRWMFFTFFELFLHLYAFMSFDAKYLSRKNSMKNCTLEVPEKYRQI